MKAPRYSCTGSGMPNKFQLIMAWVFHFKRRWLAYKYAAKMINKSFITSFIILAAAVLVAGCSNTIIPTIPVPGPDDVPDIPETYSIAFIWESNEPEDKVLGYKVYYGWNDSREYKDSVDVGDITEAVLADLQFEVTYYFAATAYNAIGESDYSNEVVYNRLKGKNDG